jgi:hypothetical protein
MSTNLGVAPISDSIHSRGKIPAGGKNSNFNKNNDDTGYCMIRILGEID